MSQPSKRVRRIADFLKREIALLMKSSINDPRLAGIMITLVDVSPDLGNARIYYTLADASVAFDANKALEKAAGFLRYELSQSTELRYTPQLSFVHDSAIGYASDLIDLIDSVQPAPAPENI